MKKGKEKKKKKKTMKGKRNQANKKIGNIERKQERKRKERRKKGKTEKEQKKETGENSVITDVEVWFFVHLLNNKKEATSTVHLQPIPRLLAINNWRIIQEWINPRPSGFISITNEEFICTDPPAK